MTERRVPTLKDVAELAGVSIQTVSSIVNHKPGYTDEMRARVQAAVAQLGYRPFAVARSLRTRQTHTIALIVSDISNPSFSGIAGAAEDYAHGFGYSVALYNTHDDGEREKAYIQMAVQRWIDGVLFVPAEDRMSSLDAFQAAGIPTVAVDRIPEGYTGPAVTIDNVKAGRIAAEHLLGLGHTRLAHISGPLRLRLARERRDGFVQTVAAAGRAPVVCVGGDGDWGCGAGYEAMREVLALNPRPTAVFSANDRMAIGALRAINEAGLRVPEDISLVGLDDIEMTAYQVPPLTTVRQSFTDLATFAVRLLLEILEGHIPAQSQVVLEPQLIVRKSTGPCPA